MPVASTPALLSTLTYKYVVSVGGQIVNTRMPLNGDGVTSFTYNMSGENGVGRATFTVEDTNNTFTIAFGAEVEIKDTSVSPEKVMWGGVLVEAQIQERGSNSGRLVICTALSYDTWLDWKIVTRFVSKKDVAASGGRSGQVNRHPSDKQMVQTIFDKFCGNNNPPIRTGGYVNETNTNMPHLEIIGATLRDALNQIAEAATGEVEVANRYFYVDEKRQLHWYKGNEALVSPYYITDDIYTRRVLATSGLVSLWRMTDTSGTTCLDSKAYANGTYTGGVTLNVASGVINEPYLKAVTLNGTTGYITASGASLHPGDTFTIELWFKRSTLGTAQTLWSSGINDVEIGFDTNNKVVVIKEGGGTNYVSTNAVTDTDWHHLAVCRVPGTTTVYLDGSVLAGTPTAQTFVAAAGAVNIGRRLSATDRYFSGSIACAAIYTTNIGATEAMAHATIGDGVNPIDLTVTLSAYDGRERVYVAGKNALASQWVPGKGNPGSKENRKLNSSTTFGRSIYGVQDNVSLRDAFLDRPDVESDDKAYNVGYSWLKRHNDPKQTATFTVVGYDGWRPGQLIYIHNTNLDCITKDANGFAADDGRGVPFEITDVEVDVSLGNGIARYTITCGPRLLRGSRILFRNVRSGDASQS